MNAKRNIYYFQIGQEISGALNFLSHVYSVFGFSFQLVLSTRPEKYLGEINMWDEAEKVMCFLQYTVMIVMQVSLSCG